MKFFFIIISLLVPALSSACDISEVKGIFYFPSLDFQSQELNRKGCSPKTLQKLKRFVIQNDGDIPTRYLSELGEFKFSSNLKVLKIQDLSSLLRAKCENPNIVFGKINFSSTQNPILINNNETLEINDLDCDGLGEKSFTIIKKKNHILISSQPVFAQLQTKMIACYIKESPINYSQSSLKKLITPKEIITSKPEDYIAFNDNLALYQLRRRPPLHKLLRIRDIKPIPLTKAGREVTLILNSRGLKVTTRGKARKTATLGEMIEAINLNSNKKVWGKVIGENEIEVKL